MQLVRKCPQCRARLEYVAHGLIGVHTSPTFYIVGHSRIELELHVGAFWACPSCEFCEERKPNDTV